jgi:hypothetical protein
MMKIQARQIARIAMSGNITIKLDRCRIALVYHAEQESIPRSAALHLKVTASTV